MVIEKIFLLRLHLEACNSLNIMKIEKPKSDDTREFKYLMQAAFQYGYESIFGKSDSEILPEKDIDRDLKKPNSHAYAMMSQNAIVGGAIITIDEKTSQGELGFPFVKVGVQGKGIGK